MRFRSWFFSRAFAAATPAASGSSAPGALLSDVRMLLGGLLHRPRPTSVRRKPRRPSVQPPPTDSLGALLSARSLRVVQIQRETPSSVAITLEDPTGQPVPFLPGQFLTLLLSIQGAPPIRRAYSIASSPTHPQRITIACKRVPSGLASTYLHEQLTPGTLLPVLGPSGTFTPKDSDGSPRRFVLIAGGSGITPILSIVRATLVQAPATQLILLYGNVSADEIMFLAELSSLAEQFPQALHVRHVLDHLPPALPPFVLAPVQGPLSEGTLHEQLAALVSPDERPTTYFVCGPAPMMDAAQRVLRARGIPDADILQERFASLGTLPTPPSGETTSDAQQVRALRISLRRGKAPATEHATLVHPQQTLLEAGLSVRKDLPFSCAMGGCGACKARLTQGEVQMNEPNCLTQAERQAGYVLCCVAHPRSDVAIEIVS